MPLFTDEDYIRYREIFKAERLPLAFVDLDKFDANVDYVASTQRQTGKTIRVGTKSVRCVELTKRIFDRGGPAFKGFLASPWKKPPTSSNRASTTSSSPIPVSSAPISSCSSI